jgi:hypothetical protein
MRPSRRIRAEGAVLNRQRTRRRAVIILVSVVLLAVPCFGQQIITGSVVDKSGKPLVGIEIWGDSLSPKIDPAHPHVYSVTDASGKFSIVNAGNTLWIQGWKYRPSRVVVTRRHAT